MLNANQQLRFRRPRPREVTTSWSPGVSIIWHADEAIYYENPRNRFCYFRKTFVLPAPAVSSELRILADTKYQLFVNGTEIGRGPSRFDPRWAYYDSYDVSPYLVEGENVIAVLVLYHGYGTGAQASILQSLLVDTRVELSSGATVTVVSDTSWRAMRAEGYDDTALRLNGRQGPMEVLDLRRVPEGWTAVGFDDSSWAATACPRPGLRNIPWFNLVPRDISYLEVGVAEAQATVGLGRAALTTPAVAELGQVRRDIVWDDASADDVVAIPADGLLLSGSAGTAAVVNVDFGVDVVGYLELDVEGPAGAVVDVLYAEELWTGVVPSGHGSRVPMDRFILDDGQNTAAVVFGWKAFRYVQLWVWAETEVRIRAVRVRTVGSPTPNVPASTTSNPRLDQILENARRTLKMCMQDGYLDSSSREQQQWMGDGGRQALTGAYLFGETRLWRRLLTQIGQSQDWTGALMPRHPGRHENISPIPQFMLDWVTSLWDYYGYTGEDDLLRDWWPNLVLCLRWFSAFENTAGLLEDVPHWMFIDWGARPTGAAPDVNRGGVVTALNIKYLAALETAVKVAAYLGDTEAVTCYREVAERLRTALWRVAWDANQGAFVDCVVHGELSPVISESANALALLYLQMPAERRAGIVNRVFEPPADETVTSDRAGQAPVIVSPYYTLEYGRALAAAGRTDLALRTMVERFGRTLDAGATTMWEMWTLFGRRGNPPAIASASHGWGAAIHAVFVETILGISSEEPGFRDITIRPRVDLLSSARGHVATPQGIVRVEWSRCAGDAQGDSDVDVEVKVSAPRGVAGRVIMPDGTVIAFANGGSDVPWGVHRRGRSRRARN